MGPIKTRVNNTVPQHCSAFVKMEWHVDVTKEIAQVKHSSNCNINWKFKLQSQDVSNYYF
jgi:hypothetical protein